MLGSQTKQPSRAKLLKKPQDDEDEPWAEVAKFNQLLDMKIKLDEASEVKGKASMQRAYLDQQIQLKASNARIEQREKTL